MTDPEHSAGDPRYPAGPGQPYHAGPDPAAPPAGGTPTAPAATPAVPAAPARRPYRAESVRGVIFSRGAGWAVAAVLAGAVVALSILLAEGNNGPVAVRIGGPPVRTFIGPQAVQVPPGILTRPGMQVLGPGFARVPPLLPAACLRAAQTPSGKASASPGSGATPAPLPSASPGQSRIQLTLPGGRGITCIITVKPG